MKKQEGPFFPFSWQHLLDIYILQVLSIVGGKKKNMGKIGRSNMSLDYLKIKTGQWVQVIHSLN